MKKKNLFQLSRQFLNAKGLDILFCGIVLCVLIQLQNHLNDYLCGTLRFCEIWLAILKFLVFSLTPHL